MSGNRRLVSFTLLVSCVVSVVVLTLVSPVSADLGRGQVPASVPDAQKERRLTWFREAKYGLFIHWGLYAIPAGEWNGRAVPGLGEWIMFRAPVPVRGT